MNEEYERTFHKVAGSERTLRPVWGKLINSDVFSSVKVDTESETLCWENLLTAKDAEGNITKANLDFCPDVLYKKSVLLSRE